MPNLFTTFGRVALVALGLAVAPAAFGQITCSKGMTPLVTGVGQQSAEAVCGLACTSGNVVALDGQGNYVCQSGGGGNVQVSGCTINPTNPAAVASGGSVTYTAKCTGGTPAAMTVQWSRTGTATLANCATSGNVNDSITCDATNITGNGTVTAVMSNGIGSSSSKTANYTVQAGGGGGGFENCPSGSLTSSSFYPHPLEGSTSEIGLLGNNQMMSIKMTVPAGASGNKSANLGAAFGGYKLVTWAVSKTACDLDSPIVDVGNSNFSKNRLKYLTSQTTADVRFNYTQGPGPDGVAGGVTMTAGQTYYLNILMQSCTNDLFGGVCWYDSVLLP